MARHLIEIDLHTSATGLDDASIEAATDIVADLILLAGDQWADILRIATDHANHERRQRGGNA
jgi:hypothetical protein